MVCYRSSMNPNEATYFSLNFYNSRFISHISLDPFIAFANQLAYNDINYPLTQWKQVGFLYLPRQMTLIQNGMIIGTHNKTNLSVATTNPVFIFLQGTPQVDHACYYKDLRIYNRHLTSEEISYIYRKGPYL